jgi:hypothetical protein
VTEDLAAHERLSVLDRPLGSEVRDLTLGRWRIRIDGASGSLATALERRWGRFLDRPACGTAPRAALRVLDAGAATWLPAPSGGELYRIEARNGPDRRIVLSYGFALRRGEGGAWRLGLCRGAVEPTERAVENALRYVAACLALEDGGFALHAAGVLREGRAFLFAGPSGAGKSTLTRLARPAASLGDDFGLFVRDGDGWAAPALPFDNAERIDPDTPQGLFPLAGIWRLEQASHTRVERLPPALAVASLLGCAAFPWAMPEQADRLLEHARAFVAAGRFERLRFALDTPLWTELV